MKLLILTLTTIIISFNCLALSKQEKVDLIAKKTDIVSNCILLFKTKSLYNKQHSNKNLYKGYKQKGKDASKLYDFLLFGIGLDMQGVETKHQKLKTDLEYKLSHDTKETLKIYQKIASSGVTREEQNCNIILKYPRTALDIAKATKPFYPKDYQNFKATRLTNCKTSCNKNKHVSLWDQKHTSTQKKHTNNNTKRNKNLYIQKKSEIVHSCIYLYKNLSNIGKHNKNTSLYKHHKANAQQGLDLYLYMLSKTGKTKRSIYNSYVSQLDTDARSKTTWGKILIERLKKIPEASFTGSYTYEQICNETLKSPYYALNLSKIIKKFYKRDYEQ
ncbi:MAG TPA: hypothetical protein DCL21_06170 [Alphaproteobacteria bacterium]|nr:hypothetical protein [Alphaproteobacteria bacterium]